MVNQAKESPVTFLLIYAANPEVLAVFLTTDLQGNKQKTIEIRNEVNKKHSHQLLGLRGY